MSLKIHFLKYKSESVILTLFSSCCTLFIEHCLHVNHITTGLRPRRCTPLHTHPPSLSDTVCVCVCVSVCVWP